MRKKVYVIILDGFAFGREDAGDAIFHAEKPYLNQIFRENSVARLKTDEASVGLPRGQVGGSEVGHMTIGAGRVITHLLTKINNQIESGEFFKNKKIVQLFESAQQKKQIHFLGMISDGGIHSYIRHLEGLQKMAEKYDIPEVYIHAITDGRDVGERTAKQYLAMTQKFRGKIASLSGRFYAMDRDTNWERTQSYYDILTNGSVNPLSITPEEYLQQYYESETTSDYYLPPALFHPEGQVRSDDVVIAFNFRTDRMRQVSQALASDDFSEFPRKTKIFRENFGIFGHYFDGAIEPFHFKNSEEHDGLGEVLAKNNKTQLRISETEKYNHVTYFFSLEHKDKFLAEDRILVPSPKCASYAEKPEMSAFEQTSEVIKRLKGKEYDFVVQNFANADLVGHSGDFHATKKSVEVLDKCLEKLIPFLHDQGYTVCITADHGNADEMILPSGEVSASHSHHPVPFVVLSPDKSKTPLRSQGTLADIAPTVLSILDIPCSEVMTGENLVE